MSAARWERLRASLGGDATIDERPYSEAVFGRVRHGVSRSIVLKVVGGTIEIRDTWWQKNPDVWTGWVVDLVDRDGIVKRSARRSKNRAQVAATVVDFMTAVTS